MTGVVAEPVGGRRLWTAKVVSVPEPRSSGDRAPPSGGGGAGSNPAGGTLFDLLGWLVQPSSFVLRGIGRGTGLITVLLMSSRRRPRGSVEPLPSGRFRAVVYAGIDPITGGRHNLTKTAADYDAAEKARTRLLNQVGPGPLRRGPWGIVDPGVERAHRHSGRAVGPDGDGRGDHGTGLAERLPRGAKRSGGRAHGGDGDAQFSAGLTLRHRPPRPDDIFMPGPGRASFEPASERAGAGSPARKSTTAATSSGRPAAPSAPQRKSLSAMWSRCLTRRRGPMPRLELGSTGEALGGAVDRCDEQPHRRRPVHP